MSDSFGKRRQRGRGMLPLEELWRAKSPVPASEDACLEIIDALFPARTVHTPTGRGDDCAVLEGLEGQLAFSTDMFWQDTHFRDRYCSPQEAGAKALSTAVSDLAAAGAVPLGFSLGLLLPGGFSLSALRFVLEGMAEAAREYGIVLSGGDLAKGDKLGFSIAVWGARQERLTPFFSRKQARPGDRIFLIGAAGLARVGLWALEHEGRRAVRSWPQACKAHLDPLPLLAQGQALGRAARQFNGLEQEAGRQRRSGFSRQARQFCMPGFSLMDLSDGLARDLPRLLGQYGAALDIDAGLIPAEVRQAAPLMHMPPEAIVLLGGEDYALLGTCPDKAWEMVAESVPDARPLGLVTEEPGLRLRGELLDLAGFDHFQGSPDEPGSQGREASYFPAGSGPEHDGPEHGVLHCDGPGAPDNPAAILIAAGRDAWQAGLMAGFNGNISCRVRQPRTGGAPGRELCAITRSGAAKGRMGPGDIALLDIASGECVDGPTASTECAVHTAIYQRCPQSNAILHCHPAAMLALDLLFEGNPRLGMPLPEAERYAQQLALVPFYAPGSAALAKAVAEAATRAPAIWMERHGLVAHGPDMAAALALTEELEQLARIRLALEQAGNKKALPATQA